MRPALAIQPKPYDNKLNIVLQTSPYGACFASIDFRGQTIFRVE
jgi:hypothetical protein